MTIHLPENLESPILAAVHNGRYASLDDAMAEAASLLVQRLKQEQAQAKPPAAKYAERLRPQADLGSHRGREPLDPPEVGTPCPPTFPSSTTITSTARPSDRPQ